MKKLIFILITFLSIFVKKCFPSLSMASQFIDKETGRKTTILVTDRLVTTKGGGEFKNFEDEWENLFKDGKMSKREFRFKMNLLDSHRSLTLKPYDNRPKPKGLPPKIQLAGHGKSPIGVTFTGNADTACNFNCKLREKKRSWMRDLYKYNTMESVANLLDRSYREDIEENEIVKPHEHLAVKGDKADIYNIMVGLDTNKPQIQKLDGHLYSRGHNKEAMNYMEQFYGPHNIEQRKIHYQPRLREYTVDEAMGHVREAMRRNAIVSAFENEGKSKVTENFDAYVFRKGKEAEYYEHEPKIHHSIAKHINKRASPVETVKKLMLNDAWHGNFALTKEQEKWSEQARRELKQEYSKPVAPKLADYKRHNKLKRSNSFADFLRPKLNTRVYERLTRRNSMRNLWSRKKNG